MNKLKRLGLTALAGSLVATSVSAGDLSVTGGASLDYTSTSETTGNGWSMGDSVNFNGCLLYTSPSPRDRTRSRMPSSA